MGWRQVKLFENLFGKKPEDDRVPPHLRHLPATCGTCNEDHRLAMPGIGTLTLMGYYLELRINLAIRGSKQPPDRVNYHLRLLETELRHRGVTLVLDLGKVDWKMDKEKVVSLDPGKDFVKEIREFLAQYNPKEEQDENP